MRRAPADDDVGEVEGADEDEELGDIYAYFGSVELTVMSLYKAACPALWVARLAQVTPG